MKKNPISPHGRSGGAHGYRRIRIRQSIETGDTSGMQRLLSAAKDGGDEWDKRGSQWEYFMDMLWGKSMFNMNKNIGK